MYRSVVPIRPLPAGLLARLAQRLRLLVDRGRKPVTRPAACPPHHDRADRQRLHRLAEKIRWFTPR